MASITIRQLDESTKARLRIRAAQRGHSMEEEAREIFKSALTTEESGQPHLVESIRRRVKAGGIAWLAKLPSVRLFTTSWDRLCARIG